MRKPIMLSKDYASISALLGGGVKAWVYGSVAKGTARDDSDIDIYVSGPCADQIERKFFVERPLVTYNRRKYPAHVIGSSMVSEADFLNAQPEAIVVL